MVNNLITCVVRNVVVVVHAVFFFFCKQGIGKLMYIFVWKGGGVCVVTEC